MNFLSFNLKLHNWYCYSALYIKMGLVHFLREYWGELLTIFWILLTISKLFQIHQFNDRSGFHLVFWSLKFRYSEKATKFWKKISPFLLTLLRNFKKKREIFIKFESFFTSPIIDLFLGIRRYAWVEIGQCTSWYHSFRTFGLFWR